ncbi:C4-dicarboxylate ABC transporter substrate-binding protein [Mesorhizobium sp. NBSH29]|uniref:TRAP transporter substrate-binding protein n=1 Tax=Mesorhizobium sp. NBSH29 TaxID=2654249 RepID=UPI0018968666|nr:TRAP transporter substrate-binding protein [Mesorhizobium sp. NBSH29]QPC88222.1 C4-dicarboxylate ABC transporter substrate-binding protein [Mesorhizobium sp. NBSH29]
MMSHYASITAGALAAGLFATGTGFAASWDMPTPYPDGNFHTKNITEFAADIAKKTSDSLKITVHSNQSLIKHPDIKTSVRDGIVPIGETLVSRLENESPIFGVDSVPFLASSYELSKKLYDAQRPYLEKLLADQGLQLLFSVPWPPQGIYVKKEINAISDLEGLKFRAYNVGTERVASLAKMVPTQIEASDVPTAFATGRVEAMITSPSTGADSKAWDFVTHYYDTQAWLPRNMVIVNKAAFDKLSDAEKAAVTEAAAAAETRGWEMSKVETEEKTKILKDNGVAIVTPSDELKAGFGEIGATITDEWKAKAGADGEALLETFRK